MRIPGSTNWCGTYNDAPAFITASPSQALLMVFSFLNLEWQVKAAAGNSVELENSLGIKNGVDVIYSIGKLSNG